MSPRGCERQDTQHIDALALDLAKMIDTIQSGSTDTTKAQHSPVDARGWRRHISKIKEKRAMSRIQDGFDRQFEELKAVRDDLEVRLHLGKLEAKDLWGELEKQWSHAEGKLKVIGDTAEDALEDVGEAAQLVLNELKEGYEKLRRLL
jgi:hypothetical protein